MSSASYVHAEKKTFLNARYPQIKQNSEPSKDWLIYSYVRAITMLLRRRVDTQLSVVESDCSTPFFLFASFLSFMNTPTTYTHMHLSL